MNRSPARSLVAALLGLALTALIVSCATQGAPIGGAKDTRGPRILSVDPPNESTQIRPSHVRFDFDEYLRAQEVDKGVFIAPPPKGRPPKVYVQGRGLHVRFRTQDLEERTYVITLGPGVKDDTEGNSIPQALQYAFTPGAQIDTCGLSGRVIDPLKNRGEMGFIVAVFDPDSVARRGLHELKPLMAAQSDSNGFFQIGYLRPGRYVAFGFKDRDYSFTWNQPSEPVAQDPDTIVVIEPGQQQTGWELFSFVNDTAPPKPRRVETLTRRSLVVELSEPLSHGRVAVGPDSFMITPQSDYLFEGSNRGKLQLFLTRPVPDSFGVWFSGLTDTVGNRMSKDSVLTVKLRRTGSFTLELKLTPGPEQPSPFDVALLGNALLPLDSLVKYVFVIDSTRKPIEGVKLRTLGAQVIVTLPPDRNPDNPLRLVVDTLLMGPDSMRLAQRARFALSYPKPDQFGEFSLRLNSTQPDLLIVLTNADDPKEVRVFRERKLDLPYLKPAKYRISVIEDADRNGRWTPGRVFPRRLSETVYHYPGTVLIRGGWSQELEITYPDPAAEQ